MRYAPGLLLLLAAAGCGVETDPRPASFRYIQAAILQPSCATAACHSSLNQTAGLVLDDLPQAYEAIYGRVGVIGDGGAFAPLVTDNLRGTGELRMPLDAPLPDADIELIVRWIDDGAENN